jgi:uncharacterized protein
MVRRAGSPDLPLNSGRVQKWLSDRISRLGAVITEAIVLEYGRDEMLLVWRFAFLVRRSTQWHVCGGHAIQLAQLTPAL